MMLAATPGLPADSGEAFSVFVGDISPDVNDFLLQETFRQFYPTVKSAKVITDPATGRSKGYGFVRFSSEPERDRALAMQGFNLAGRPIRVSLATARRNATAGAAAAPAAPSAPHPADLDPTNTTLFIGGLSAGVSEDQLRLIFGSYGDIVYTKIPAGKGCGFVQFVERPAAEMAMAALNGQVIGANGIRISWGRSTSRAPARDAGGAPAGGAGAAAAAAAAAAGAFGGAFGGGGAGFPGAGFPAGGYGGYGAAGMLGNGAFAPGAGFGRSAPMGAPPLSLYGAPASQPPPSAALNGGFGPGLGAAAGGLLSGLGLGFGGGGGAGALGLPFDPAAAPSIDKLNAAFAARQQQLLGGGAFLLPRT